MKFDIIYVFWFEFSLNWICLLFLYVLLSLLFIFSSVGVAKDTVNSWHTICFRFFVCFILLIIDSIHVSHWFDKIACTCTLNSFAFSIIIFYLITKIGSDIQSISLFNFSFVRYFCRPPRANSFHFHLHNVVFYIGRFCSDFLLVFFALIFAFVHDIFPHD